MLKKKGTFLSWHQTVGHRSGEQLVPRILGYLQQCWEHRKGNWEKSCIRWGKLERGTINGWWSLLSFKSEKLRHVQNLSWKLGKIIHWGCFSCPIQSAGYLLYREPFMVWDLRAYSKRLPFLRWTCLGLLRALDDRFLQDVPLTKLMLDSTREMAFSVAAPQLCTTLPRKAHLAQSSGDCWRQVLAR